MIQKGELEVVTRDEQLKGLAGLAMNGLEELFRRDAGELSSKDIGLARIQTAVISAWTRLEQSRSSHEATLFGMARELAGNRDELRQYMAMTMPESAIVKALPTPK